jgi:hypothetical protein
MVDNDTGLVHLCYPDQTPSNSITARCSMIIIIASSRRPAAAKVAALSPKRRSVTTTLQPRPNRGHAQNCITSGPLCESHSGV